MDPQADNLQRQTTTPCQTLEKVITQLDTVKGIADSLSTAQAASYGIDGPDIKVKMQKAQDEVKAAAEAFKGLGVCG